MQMIATFNLRSLECPFNFQIRQIPIKKQHFSENNDPFSINILLRESRLLQKTLAFFQVKSSYHRLANRGNLICWRKITAKIYKTWWLALQPHKFLSYLQFFKVGELWAFNTSKSIFKKINPRYLLYRGSSS